MVIRANKDERNNNGLYAKLKLSMEGRIALNHSLQLGIPPSHAALDVLNAL
ncbi:MAG: hypothetical protein ACXV7G_13560 [Halobacteriota archaeon]